MSRRIANVSNPFELKLYRVMTLLILICIPIYQFFVNLITPDFHTPYWSLAIIMGYALVLFIFSYFSSYIMQHYIYAFYILMHLCSIATIYSAILNQFHLDIIISCFIHFFLFILFHKHVRALQIYVILFTITFTAVLHIFDNPYMNSYLISFSFILVGIIAYIATKVRLNALSMAKESEQKYRLISENVQEIIFLQDTDSTLFYVSLSIQSVLNYSPKEWIGKKLEEFTHPEDYQEILIPAYQRLLRLERDTDLIVYRVMHKDGQYMWIESYVKYICDPQKKKNYFQFSCRDITKRKIAQEKLYELAYEDPLTHLPNRLWLHENLSKEIENSILMDKKLAVLLFDIDNFKIINDSLGHDAGDTLLQDVALRLNNMVENNPNYSIARMGGDEFLLYIRNLSDQEELSSIPDKLIEMMKEPFYIYGQWFNITISIGICILPQDGMQLETLLKNADIAMYQSKENGKNGYSFFTSSMNEKVIERLTIESNLKKAIELDEFILYYQPKININDEKVIGMEALLRWKHSKKGWISPSTFIPIAEESGLIEWIDNWVIREACKQNKVWQDMGYEPLVMSVNLSAQQFQNRNIIQKIEDVLQETKLDPKWLELEVTEGTLMKNPMETASLLHKLKQLGVSLSIDDFGTGFSSLNYLRHFPIDILKIDKSFIQDLTKSNKNQAIVSSIINLAHSLDMRVLAEGVETVSQFDYLEINQCQYIQGYYLSPALDSEAFSRFMDQQKYKKIMRAR